MTMSSSSSLAQKIKAPENERITQIPLVSPYRSILHILIILNQAVFS